MVFNKRIEEALMFSNHIWILNVIISKGILYRKSFERLFLSLKIAQNILRK